MTAEPAPPPRTTSDQLLLDLATLWQDRYNTAQRLPRGSVFDPHDPAEALWRATAAGLTDAWAALYLLALLREHAPIHAAQAAEVLAGGPRTLPSHRMPGLVEDWADAVAAGRTLGGLLP